MAKVLIAGELPFVREIGDLCLDAGHDCLIYLVEDFLDAVEGDYLSKALREVEVVVEVHNESAEAKKELIFTLGNAIAPNALLLTSALSASATQAAAWVPHPERVVGFGLVPPLGKTGLVELALGLNTSEAALDRARQFWSDMGYEPILVGDGPGLVRARIVCCLINEAVTALQEGVAAVADIDQAMKLGTNYPFGPLEWADYLGLDTVLGVMTGLFEEWGDDRYRPNPLLRRMVISGRLGKKTGRGFYEYP